MANRLSHWMTQNWALKLAALSLAVLLWMAVRADTEKTSTFRNVAVEVDLRDPDWQLARKPDPSGVHVTVRGSTGELLTLAGQPPRIILPVERVADTVETRVVPIQWVQLPRDVREARVVALRPDTIRLRYERVDSRTLPIQVRLTGDLPEGYELERPITTSPSVIDVRGPLRLVAALDSVPLVPVDVSGLRSTTNIPAMVDTTEVEGLRVEPREVNVVLRVRPADPEAAEPIQETAARRRGFRF